MNLPKEYWYLHVGRANELTGRDRVIYRFFEMLPGLLSIGTLLLFVALSFLVPVWAAYLTIIFAIYWLLKTIYLSAHLRHNFKRVRHNLGIDWNDRLKNLSHQEITHLVIFPFYTEGYEVVAESVRGLLASKYDHKRIAVVIAAEERAGKGQRAIADRIAADFSPHFGAFIVTEHPAGLPGELAGKGSNISYAAEEARKRILDAQHIPYEKVIVSA